MTKKEFIEKYEGWFSYTRRQDLKKEMETDLEEMFVALRQPDVVRRSEQLVCQESKLDCPYDFTSRCTLGRCDCKPKAN